MTDNKVFSDIEKTISTGLLCSEERLEKITNDFNDKLSEHNIKLYIHTCFECRKTEILKLDKLYCLQVRYDSFGKLVKTVPYEKPGLSSELQKLVLP